MIAHFSPAFTLSGREFFLLCCRVICGEEIALAIQWEERSESEVTAQPLNCPGKAFLFSSLDPSRSSPSLSFPSSFAFAAAKMINETSSRRKEGRKEERRDFGVSKEGRKGPHCCPYVVLVVSSTRGKESWAAKKGLQVDRGERADAFSLVLRFL